MARVNMLSRRQVLDTALGVANEEGLEAVTMRRVAHLLGAGTMSIYYYVPNKEALLEGMVDFVFEQVGQPPEDMPDWADRVVFISLSFRKAALAHPAVLALIAGGYISGPSVLGTTEAYLGEILHRGFTLEMTTHIYRAATSYVIGYLSLETGGYFGPVVESHQRGRFAGDGSGEYPLLSGIATRFGSWDPECEFEVGLRRLLASFHSDLGTDTG